MTTTITGATGVSQVQAGAIEHGDLPAGSVLNVIQTHVATTSTQSLTSSTRANITGLTATITPKSTSSKIMVEVRWVGEFSNANNYDTVFGIRRGGVDVGNPVAAGSRYTGISGITIGYDSQEAHSTPDSAMYSYLDSPAASGSVTYTASILHRYTGTLYNNRTVDDADGVNYERLTSSITLTEIAG